MDIKPSSNLSKESKIYFFSIDLENYKHKISMFLDDLSRDEIFLYVYEYKYIYNGRTHVIENRTATALTNALSSDFDKAYNISTYEILASYFKEKYNNDEFAYRRIINDIKAKGIGVDEEVDQREEDNFEYLKRIY